MINSKLQIALTFDDAPSIKESGIVFLPERMDKIISILKQHKIKYCTAFVVGENALGHEQQLENWLNAGFQLANHTFFHQPCSQLNNQEFKQTVSKCHDVLVSIGAFELNSEQWFRFPYLDRGSHYQQINDFKLILADLGYTAAHASINFNDHQYELPLKHAIDSNNKNILNKVSHRYINNVIHAIDFAKNISSKKYAKDISHIAYAHYGDISVHLLDKLLSDLQAKNINWCSLASASDSVYAEFETQNRSNGLLVNPHEIDAISLKIKRKLSSLSVKFNLFQQQKYGPIWPYLE